MGPRRQVRAERGLPDAQHSRAARCGGERGWFARDGVYVGYNTEYLVFSSAVGVDGSYGGAFFLGSATDYFSPPLVAYAASTVGVQAVSVLMVRSARSCLLRLRIGWVSLDGGEWGTGWGADASYGAEMAANGAANLGLRDQIMALEWVRDHIGAFGGDPHKVRQVGT